MPETTTKPVRKSPGSNMMGIYFMFMMLSLIIVMSPEIRESIAYAVGFVFYPLLGFGGNDPVLTIFLAGIIVTLINTYTRHYFSDWVKFGRTQAKLKAIQKLVRETMRTRDRNKLEKYRKLQSKMMPEQMNMMNAQMKPMMITMLLVIAIFTWLYIYLGASTSLITIPHAHSTVFAVPWASAVPFNHYIAIIPYWMIFYAVMTMALTQVMTYIFKLIEFSKRIKTL